MTKSYSILRFLPLCSAILPWLTFALTYGLSVAYKIYPEYLPYISHTGNHPPASSFFTLGLNLTAFTMFPTLYIQYQRLKISIEHHLKKRVATPSKSGDLEIQEEEEENEQQETCSSFFNPLFLMNRLSFFMGLFSIIGIIMVGAFQEKLMFKPHIAGAGLTFVCVCLYQLLIILILFNLNYFVYRRRLFISRCCLCFLSICFLIAMFSLFVYIARRKSKDDVDNYAFSPDCPWHAQFVASSVCEWLLALCSFMFVATFYFDFRHVGMNLHVMVRKLPGVDEVALL